MSNQVVAALERGAKRVVHALGEGATKAEHKLLHETADNLETAAKKHIAHDGKAAKDLESAAKKVDSPTIPGARVNGKLPKHGAPNSYGYDEHGNRMPYANGRPPYGPDQVGDVWDDAKDANGDVWVRDKDGNRVKVEWEPGEPRRDVWDMGHVPEHEYRDLLDDYLHHRITKEEFLEEYRDPDNYQVEHPGRNRSHVDEAGR
jgi:ribosomal protein S20